jgi:polyisoprenoid-binding protein YceI
MARARVSVTWRSHRADARDLRATPVRAETEADGLDRTISAVDFTIYASKIFTFKREGQFKEFTGQLSFNPANPLDTHVDLTSIPRASTYTTTSTISS